MLELYLSPFQQLISQTSPQFTLKCSRQLTIFQKWIKAPELLELSK